jgi:hypothetical protein
MGWSRHHQVGLIHYEPSAAYRGYTLVATNGGFHANLIDMEGRICHRWNCPEGVHYCYLLPNGNLFVGTNASKEVDVGSIGGSNAGLQELDWEGNVVWEWRNPLVHHDFKRLPNGNTVAITFERMPADLSAKVQGGFTTPRDDEQMISDLVQEIEPDGTVVWEWRAWQHLDLEQDTICPLEGRREWTHQNSLTVLPDNQFLVSFRQISTIGIVDGETGAFKWKWGPGEISHQHHPTWLDNGRVLLFDNGAHRRGVNHSRILEVEPETNEIAWEYHGDPIISFYSYNISGAERLPNGNTLICEGAPGRVFEVTHQGRIVWEYINPNFVPRVAGVIRNTEAGVVTQAPAEAELVNMTFRAHRYGPDHPALEGKDLDPAHYGNLNRIYAAG